jgi:hypothetical protein
VHALGDGGVIRDWLVSPAWRAACDADLASLLRAGGPPWGDDGRWTLSQGPEVAPLKERLYRRRPLVTDQVLPPAEEGGPVSWTAPGGSVLDEGTWRRVHGDPDWSDFCFLPEYRHAVAVSCLEVDQPEWREIEVACTGPVAVWLGADLLGVYTDVSYMEPVPHPVRARLGSGLTPLFLATWQVGFREVRHVARVSVRGLPVRVVIPCPGADERASALAESVLDAVAVDSWAIPGDTVGLSGPAGVRLSVSRPGAAEQVVVLDKGRGRYRLSGQPSSTGETTLTVRVDDPRCPVTRELPVAVLPPRVRSVPAGDDPAVWRREVLSHAASSPPSVARALASGTIRDGDLDQALYLLANRADCADFEAVGLLNLWHADIAWPAGARERVKEALLGFKYWIDQPGLDAMCYFTENHQLVFHTAELLAGLAFPDSVFANTGWTGAEHAGHGTDMALDWIRAKLTGGFSEFDSNAYLAIDSLALVSLVELCSGSLVPAAARALLDKLLFTLAANSWHGIHGAAHGRSYAQTLRSSRFEETAPIMWALCGTGALNGAVLPATCLARSRRYTAPDLVRAVAGAGSWEGRQVYAGQYAFPRDLLSRPYGSDLRVWKTPHAMLSSVQDYRSGLPGLQEHIWGATLGTEAQVFATYPGSSSDSPSARPNAWAGQRILPRARQHKDSVLVFYPGLKSVPSHVWFPVPFLDEHTASGCWLAGRVGDGYVAVACAGGLSPVLAGSTARQEWLPGGPGTAFVATVGCRDQDGSFGAFVAALSEPSFPADGVVWRARDGRLLSLRGAFTVDGAPPDIGADGLPDTGVHLDNPACVSRFGDTVLNARYNTHTMTVNLRAR